MAINAGTELTGDSVVLQISDGSATVEFDVAGEISTFLFPMGSHSTEKWNSQHVKRNVITKDGTYDAITITHTFNTTDYNQIETWWKATNESLTYSVSGGGAPTKSYTNCHVRVTDGPRLVPGSVGLQTVSIEIQCMQSITGT